MMKSIRVFGIHPYCNDVDSFLNCFHITELKDEFNFIFDKENPEFIVATEWIYNSYSYKKILNSFKDKQCIRIYYAGEASSPDFNIFDYALGWDSKLSNDDRFTLLPSQFVFASEGFIKQKKNDIITTEQAKAELTKKRGFCNFLYSNPNAHPMRDRLFFEISKYKKVDSLGKHLNNVGTKGTGYGGHTTECSDIKSLYKFSIACENARFVGYTSEKIFTSLNAHTIPIYWGDPSIEDIINPDCFINANKAGSFEELLSWIRDIDVNDEKWCKMISAPWMTEDQELKEQQRNCNAINFFRNIFEQEMDAAKRIPEGTYPNSYRKWFYSSLGFSYTQYVCQLLKGLLRK